MIFSDISEAKVSMFMYIPKRKNYITVNITK